MKDILYIQKRNGRVVPFEKKLIEEAILAAFEASNEGNQVWASQITESIVEILSSKFKGTIPEVEEIQDVVVDALIAFNFTKTVKEYITHRYKRSQERELI